MIKSPGLLSRHSKNLRDQSAAMLQRGFTLFELVIGMVVLAIALTLLTGILAPLHRDSGAIWLQVRSAELAQSLSQRARRGKAVNLDPAALLMDMVLKLEETAGSLAHR